MLLMVVERFKGGGIEAVGERFRARGRMMPDDVSYVSSWLDPRGTVCYQLMEAPGLDSLKPWMSQWDDLMDFEAIPVMASAEFWANAKKG